MEPNEPADALTGRTFKLTVREADLRELFPHLLSWKYFFEHSSIRIFYLILFILFTTLLLFLFENTLTSGIVLGLCITGLLVMAVLVFRKVWDFAKTKKYWVNWISNILTFKEPQLRFSENAIIYSNEKESLEIQLINITGLRMEASLIQVKFNDQKNSERTFLILAKSIDPGAFEEITNWLKMKDKIHHFSEKTMAGYDGKRF